MMTKTNEAKIPTHTIYFLKADEVAQKVKWIKAGVAWEHGDGEGLNLSLNSLGQHIALTVRKNKPQID